MVWLKLIVGLIVCLPLYVEFFFVCVLWVFTLVNLDGLRQVAIANKCEKRALTILDEVSKVMPLQVKKSNEENSYVPISFREEPNPPALKLKRLKPLQAARLRDNQFELSATGKVKSIRLMSVRTHMVIKQLVGWENVTDEEGRDIPFDEKAQEDMYDMLPAEVQQELESVFGAGKYDAEAEERYRKIQEDDEDDEEDEEDDEEMSGLVD